MDPSRSGDKATVEMFAISMLNNELRPFLAKWHSSLRRFEEETKTADDREWPAAQECRSELETLRQSLIKYAQAFGELAGIKDVEAYFQSQAEGHHG